MNKRGISAIIATVLIMLLVVVGVAVIWTVVLPMVRTDVSLESAGGVAVVVSEGYTSCDAVREVLTIQVKQAAGDVDVEKVKLTIGQAGNSYSKIVDAPGPNNKRTYAFDVSGFGCDYDYVTVSPVVRGSSGSSSSKVGISSGSYSGSGSGLESFFDDEGEEEFLITGLAFMSTWNTSKSGESASNEIKLPLESGGTYDFVVDWGDGSNDTITVWDQAEGTHTYVSEGVYDVNITGIIRGFNFNYTGDNLKIMDISQWGDLNVGNGGHYFEGASNLDVSATDALDLTGTTDLSYMFRHAFVFNGDMDNWDVSNVVNMYAMFDYTGNFNGNISTWDTSSVTDMGRMFIGDGAFNQPLNDWDTSSVTSMKSMFNNADAFNQPLNNWDTSSVTDMESMFNSIPSFNQPLNNWDTSSVTIMKYMFNNAPAFNGNISTWDTSSVDDMQWMFSNAGAFSQPLNDWDVSGVENMNHLFSNAGAFSQPLNNWNTSNVTDMGYMFNNAEYFNQDLSGWCVAQIASVPSSFDSSANNWVLPNSRPVWGTCP